jgi:hypothetical protein
MEKFFMTFSNINKELSQKKRKQHSSATPLRAYTLPYPLEAVQALILWRGQ